MMSDGTDDIARAREGLPGNSAVLCKGDKLVVLKGRGISPLLGAIESGEDFSGFSCADMIVGKAAALLFIKMNVACVFGEVMSKPAKSALEGRGIGVFFSSLVDRIANRAGDGLCPMESAVMRIDDSEEGYHILKKKALEMEKAAKSRL